MSDHNALLNNFVDAALALMGYGISKLSPEKAIIVDRAQKAGADVCLVFSPGAGTVVGAIHMPDSDTDPVTLFQILIPSSEVSN